MPKAASRMPVLNRALSVRADSLNEEQRTVDLVFATERAAPMWHWDLGDYDEILDCNEKAADLSRIRAGGALLREHKRDQQIGVIESATFENGQGIARARFSKSALGEQEFQDVKAGIRRNFSVSYRVKELTAEKVSDEDGNVYRATSWEPLEISLVSVPADVNCQALRSASREKTETQPITINVPATIKLSDSMKQRSLFFRKEDSGGQSGSDNTPPKPDPAEMQRQVEAEVAKREAAKKANVAALREAAVAFKDCALPVPEDMLNNALDNNTPVENFRQSVIEHWRGKQKQPTASASGRIEVIGDRAEAKTLGQRFVESRAYLDIQKARGSGAKVCALEIDEFDNFRATFATTSVTGFSGIVQLPTIYQIGVQRPTVADLLAQGTTNLNAVPFMKETSITNAADTVAEGGAKPEATFALTQTSAPVVKVAVTIPVTDEAFEDVASLQSYIDARLRWMVEMKEESQLLSGDGVGANMTGILNTSGIQTEALGANTKPDSLYLGITKIRSVGFFEPDGAVFHPNDWAQLKLLKDANNQYFGGGPFTGSYGTPYTSVERIWGLPAVITTSITEGTALLGAFRLGAMIFRKKGITIDSTNSHASEFTSNIVRLRAEERLALAVFRPKAFCTVTGI